MDRDFTSLVFLEAPSLYVRQGCARGIRQGDREDNDQYFCSNKCFHDWDKAYKNTPERIAAQRQNTITMLKNGRFARISKPEKKVQKWLDDHNLKYTPQVYLPIKCMVDFRVGNTLVEVNGCYFHSCPTHHPNGHSLAQKERKIRDERFLVYCKENGIPVITIWEHSIKIDDFSDLFPLLSA